MSLERLRPGPIGRVFLTCAAVAVVPVVILGLVLAASYRTETDRRGLAEGRSQARLVARTAVEPALDGHPLAEGVTTAEQTALTRVATRAVANGAVLRLRVRDLAGRVVFSDDGSGFQNRPDDEVLAAARGGIVSRITRVNTDRNDHGTAGVTAVEVYQPVSAGSPSRPVGVLELYLPYAPISHELRAGLGTLYRDLAIGLAVLYVVLFGISASVTRRLRRQIAVNTFLAEHDTLTELPNRDVFYRRARAAVARAGRHPVTLGIIDLDRFKNVNDSLGHHRGDRLLIALARRLSGLVRRGDTIARLGGDEFGILLGDVTDPQAVLAKIRAAIHDDIDVDGLPLSVEASIGFVLAPVDGDDVDVLLQRADVAMYAAKAEHAGVLRYDDTQDHYDADTLALVTEFGRAIENDELVLHYQPTIALGDGRPHSIEALLRWQHPRYGLLPPDRFLAIVECTDLIDPLTDWVLRTALGDLARLDGGSELAVAVNVSARNLSRADFASRVRDTLTASRVDAPRLVIEMTETALLTDRQRAAELLRELHDAGVQVSLDDFGAGQTSLGYLSGLPLRELKIDQCFIVDIVENPAHAAIVRSIVDLGHNLALRVVAEGIETAEILRHLRADGCDIAQGYFLARPMLPDRLAGWLDDYAAVGSPA